LIDKKIYLKNKFLGFDWILFKSKVEKEVNLPNENYIFTQSLKKMTKSAYD